MKLGRGYTLLEMLAVVGVLALATAMIAPTGYRMVRSWQDADAIKQVLRELSRLPINARQSGTTLMLDAGLQRKGKVTVALPDGWTLVLDSALIIGANGACGGTTGILDTGYNQFRFAMDAPYCRAQLLDAEAP